MTSNQRAPYALGYTRVTMASNKGSRQRELQLIPEIWPQFGLQAETRLHEAGIASNRGSERHGEYVLEPCTHRPSSEPSRQCPKCPDWGTTAGSVRSAKS